MSPHAVSNFVGDLIEMAKAFEDLPKVQAELGEIKADNDKLHQTVMEREQAIQDYKATIDDLQRKVRDLEVARDDAELRFLEADDKLHGVAKAFQVALEAMDGADKVIEQATTKPELTPEPKQDERVADPTPAQAEATIGSTNSSEAIGSTEPSWASPHSHDAPPAGQSEADPTMNANSGGSSSEQTSATSSATEDATSDKPKPGPYANKRYYDHQFYVNREQWLAGGGSEADYDWRPISTTHSGRFA